MKYKDIEYPTRTFTVHSDETGEEIITIAPESLGSLLIDGDGDPVDDEAEALDEQIYHYVPDRVMDYDPADICENALDIKFTFIEEL